MAGSHRAPQPEAGVPVRRWLVLALVVVIAAVAAVLITGRARDSGDDTGAAAPTPSTTTSSSPSPTPTPTPSPTPTPTTPAPTPKATRPPLPRLAAASPRELIAGDVFAAGFDDSIEPDGDRFRTRSTAELSRWGSRGLPASPGTDTVFVIGRIAPDGDSGFGRLPSLAPRAKVDIRTDAGTLTYTVGTVSERPAAGLTRSTLVTERVPGRLVLVGLRYGSDGRATGRLVVVTARLSAVRR